MGGEDGFVSWGVWAGHSQYKGCVPSDYHLSIYLGMLQTKSKFEYNAQPTIQPL